MRFGASKGDKRNISSFTTFAKEGTLPGLITASGELQSEKSVNISPKRQGILEEIYVEAGENDNLIIDKLVADPGAIGVFGYSFLDQNRDKVKPSEIDGVLPKFEDISSLLNIIFL